MTAIGLKMNRKMTIELIITVYIVILQFPPKYQNYELMSGEPRNVTDIVHFRNKHWQLINNNEDHMY